MRARISNPSTPPVAPREAEALNTWHTARRRTAAVTCRMRYTFLYAWSHRGRRGRRALVPRVTLPSSSVRRTFVHSYARQMGHDEKASVVLATRKAVREKLPRGATLRSGGSGRENERLRGTGLVFPPGDPPRDFEHPRYGGSVIDLVGTNSVRRRISILSE